MHLVCRRQQPKQVVQCILQVLYQLWLKEFNDTAGVDQQREQQQQDCITQPNITIQHPCNSYPTHLGGVTMDDQTALHFATYCSASPQVINLLLQ